MNAISRQAGRFRGFLAEVRQELKKCAWPTRSELTESTGVVIVSVVLLAVFVGLCDVVLMGLLRAVIR
ncbi:MAG: preprotein translocase subunit SecE [Kiritimatiellia bacterium]|nr:preprotein translocase subunit SecE [Kiritimatiellia bacterium]